MRTYLFVHGDVFAKTFTKDGQRKLRIVKVGEGVVGELAIPQGPLSIDRAGRVLLPDGSLVDITAKQPRAKKARVVVENATLVPDGESALVYAPPSAPFKKKAGVLRVDLGSGAVEVLWEPKTEKVGVIFLGEDDGKPAPFLEPPASGTVIGDGERWALLSEERIDVGRGKKRGFGFGWKKPGDFVPERATLDLAHDRVIVSGALGVMGLDFDGEVKGDWLDQPFTGNAVVREHDVVLCIAGNKKGPKADYRLVCASLDAFDMIGYFPKDGGFETPRTELALALADDGSLLVALESAGPTLVQPVLPDRWSGTDSVHVLDTFYERMEEKTKIVEAPASEWAKALDGADLGAVTEELELDLELARKTLARAAKKKVALDALFGKTKSANEEARRRFAGVLLARDLQKSKRDDETVPGDLVIAPGDHKVVTGNLTVMGSLEVAGKLTVLGDLTVGGFMEDHFTNPAQVLVGGKLTVGRALLSEGFLAVAGRVKAPFVILTFNQGEAKLFSGVEAKALVEADHGGTRVRGPVDVTWIRRDEARFDEEHEFDGAEKGKAAAAVSKPLAKELSELDGPMEIAEKLWPELRCGRA